MIIIASIGAYSLGQGAVWTSPVLPYIKESCLTNDNIDNTDCSFQFSNKEASWITSVFPLAATFSGE